MQCPNLGLQIQNHSQSLNDGLGDQVGSVVGVQPVTADNASTALTLKCLGALDVKSSAAS